MAFNEQEISQHLETIENEFWVKHRPPINLRDKIREGQRISGQSIELFFERPAFQRPGKFIEESVAKICYVRSRDVWELYWQRADLKFHRYDPQPEVASLSRALAVIGEDSNCCFFG